MKNQSYSNLGTTYGENFEVGSEETKNFLAGSQYFKTTEIEIFV
jgi:hypothetical protein